MKYYARKEEHRKIDSGHGHWSYPLLDEKNGCVSDCMSGISVYSQTQFTPPAEHSFQEGFLVLSGTGEAQVANEVFFLEPEMSFLVPAHHPHSLRSNHETTPLVLFWFHAGV